MGGGEEGRRKEDGRRRGGGGEEGGGGVRSSALLHTVLYNNIMSLTMQLSWFFSPWSMQTSHLSGAAHHGPLSHMSSSYSSPSSHPRDTVEESARPFERGVEH